MKLLLFVVPGCAQCQTVIDYLNLRDIDHEVIDAKNEIHFDKVQRYGIGRVPALVVCDDSGVLTDSATGFEDIQALLEYL